MTDIPLSIPGSGCLEEKRRGIEAVRKGQAGAAADISEIEGKYPAIARRNRIAQKKIWPPVPKRKISA